MGYKQKSNAKPIKALSLKTIARIILFFFKTCKIELKLSFTSIKSSFNEKFKRKQKALQTL